MSDTWYAVDTRPGGAGMTDPFILAILLLPYPLRLRPPCSILSILPLCRDGHWPRGTTLNVDDTALLEALPP